MAHKRGFTPYGKDNAGILEGSLGSTFRGETEVLP